MIWVSGHSECAHEGCRKIISWTFKAEDKKRAKGIKCAEHAASN